MKRYKKFLCIAKLNKKAQTYSKKHKNPSNSRKNKNVPISEKYKNPPIPEGYKHLYGEWNNGFIIERNSDGSQFAWVPVGCLKSNGTIDGKTFSKKFGRRNYNKEDEFEEYYDPSNEDFFLQIESVKKYGGFYISCYNISKNEENGKPQSIRGEQPWINIDFNDARNFATIMENSCNIKSHLVYGAEYDSVLEWFIESGAKTFEEIANDSSKWGNCAYMDIKREVEETGLRKRWIVNNICDFAGNVEEWTQECKHELPYGVLHIVRGGNTEYEERYFMYAENKCLYKNGYSVSKRESYGKKHIDRELGFRIALYIK